MMLAMLAAGCGNIGKSSIVMDIPDEKTATFEFNRASVDDFVQAGYISVAEGEGIEVVSDLNELHRSTGRPEHRRASRHDHFKVRDDDLRKGNPGRHIRARRIRPESNCSGQVHR